jgi:phage regulator Rha-like protein
MNEIEGIKSKIYEIRGKQVMLDSDLALLYGVETKRINQAVNRNKEKFSNDIAFKVNGSELNLRSQFVTSSSNQYGGRRYNPYVFTEEGIYMLATILKSKVAVNTTIQIIHAFTNMRHFINDNYDLIKRITVDEYKLVDHEDKINYLMDKFDEKKIPTQKIFFEGQIFDAYICLMEILSKAKEEVIIIDNYVSIELLKIIKDINVKVIFVSKNIDDEMIKKYKAQYNNFKGVFNNSFHDRFIIIDRKILYHSGASFKDLGNKCFAITLIDDETILNGIIKEINKEI